MFLYAEKTTKQHSRGDFWSKQTLICFTLDQVYFFVSPSTIFVYCHIQEKVVK